MAIQSLCCLVQRSSGSYALFGMLGLHALLPPTHCGEHVTDDEGVYSNFYDGVSDCHHDDANDHDDVHCVFRVAGMRASQTYFHPLIFHPASLPAQGSHYVSCELISRSTSLSIQASLVSCELISPPTSLPIQANLVSCELFSHSASLPVQVSPYLRLTLPSHFTPLTREICDTCLFWIYLLLS